MYDKPLSDPLPKSPASSYYGNRALGKENTQTFQKILDVRFELALMWGELRRHYGCPGRVGTYGEEGPQDGSSRALSQFMALAYSAKGIMIALASELW